VSAMTDAWVELLAANVEAVGQRLVTVGTVAVSKSAIVSESPFNDMIAKGGVFNEGDLTLQMLVSDFSGTPASNDAVTVLGRSLFLLNYEDNDGVRYLHVSDLIGDE